MSRFLVSLPRTRWYPRRISPGYGHKTIRLLGHSAVELASRTSKSSTVSFNDLPIKKVRKSAVEVGHDHDVSGDGLEEDTVVSVKKTKRKSTTGKAVKELRASQDGVTPIEVAEAPVVKKTRKKKVIELAPVIEEEESLDESLPELPPQRKARKSPKSKAKELEQEQIVRIDRPAGWTPTIDDLVEDAICREEIPDTQLLKDIYRNYLRFPDCIVLTRVGKFYEVYYTERANQIRSILDIRIANKSAKGRDGVATALDGGQRYLNSKLITYPMAGFPLVQLDKYLKHLVQVHGYTVVLVEEYDKVEVFKGEGSKDRKVGRVVTPGTLLDESWLSGEESRYLLSISVSESTTQMASTDKPASMGLWLAYTDASTGEFYSKESTLAQLEDELARIVPREIVLDNRFKGMWKRENDLAVDTDNLVDHRSVEELLHFLRVMRVHVSFADTYRPPDLDSGEAFPPTTSTITPGVLSLEAQAISLLNHHLQYALREWMPTLNEPDRQLTSAHMHIDAATLNALEIKHSMRSGEEQTASPLSLKGTLLSVIRRTRTPSGYRILVRTLTAPSTSVKEITYRQDLVQAFVEREDLREEIQRRLAPLKDVMRLVQRFKGKRGEADDLWDTASWIRGIEQIRDRIRDDLDEELVAYGEHQDLDEDIAYSRLRAFVAAFKPVLGLAERIEAAIDEDTLRAGVIPASALSDEVEAAEEQEKQEEDEDSGEVDEIPDITFPPGMIKTTQNKLITYWKLNTAERRQFWILPGFTPELQALHDKYNALLAERDALEATWRERFRVKERDCLILEKSMKYGYNLWTSSREVRNAMRSDPEFAVPDAQGQSRVVFSQRWTSLGYRKEDTLSKMLQEQYKASRLIRQMVVDVADDLQHNAGLIDELDLAMSFAETACEKGYVRPKITDGAEFFVEEGRHPSVESALHSSARMFTPNTTNLSPASHLHVITGPNQGGKSTYLRQTAVIAILAQSGSFVPADEAEIGIVDKVFSRIGARDDLFRDRSTFMLEMVETAAILQYATSKSLVIMDEIGRGTTLQAGISIAFATLDYILSRIKCRTLFATHYHELGSMLTAPDPTGVESASRAQSSQLGSTDSIALKNVADEYEPQMPLDEVERYDPYSHLNEEKSHIQRPPNVRPGVEFWCTDVDESDDAFAYSYRLRPGINFNPHAILAARMAGMPREFLTTARETLERLQLEEAGRSGKDFDSTT